jgi:hypothetical protein
MNSTTEVGSRDDVHEAGEAVGGVHFDLNDGAFEADDGAGVDSREHGAGVRLAWGRSNKKVRHPLAIEAAI